MKRIFRKNQVIITALALMIAAAGYISYTRSGISDTETSARVRTQVSENTDTEKTEEKKTANTQETSETAAQEEPGQTVLASSDASTSDFASEVKLEREQVRSKNKEDLLEIINNDSLTEAQKQEAVDRMVELTDIAERENAAEILLEAKGFSNVVVSITDDGADVVLDMGEVTDARRAQIEDIMKRKTGVPAENIVITPLAEKQEQQEKQKQ